MHWRLIGHQGRAGYPAKSKCRFIGFENTQINNAWRNDQSAGVNVLGRWGCLANRGNFAVLDMQI